VERNAAKAIELYVKAAEQGSEFAPYELGNIYYSGVYGVADNKTEALKCFRVAVERGYGTFALRWVEELEDELAEEAAA
jgi:TPR repeat protein